jgi:hypothetical protein
MMKSASEGDVFKVGADFSVPQHYFIILNMPRTDGTFLAVCISDSHHHPAITDIWPYNYLLCPTFSLAKPSVIAVQFAVVKDQAWLERNDAIYVGEATPEALQRARCNLHWFKSLVKPDVSAYFRWYGSAWTAHCGSCPQNPSKPSQ